MSELAILVPASFLEVAHLWKLLLLPGLLLLPVWLLPVLLLLDLLLLHVLPAAPAPLLNPDSWVEEMTASPGQEPALLTSGTGSCPLFVTTMRDSFKPTESFSLVLRFFVLS